MVSKNQCDNIYSEVNVRAHYSNLWLEYLQEDRIGLLLVLLKLKMFEKMEYYYVCDDIIKSIYAHNDFYNTNLPTSIEDYLIKENEK